MDLVDELQFKEDLDRYEDEMEKLKEKYHICNVYFLSAKKSEY
jgi:hypothetical protein